MGPFLFLYAALAGFFAFASIYHLILWWSSRRETLLVVFGVDCALRAIFSGVLVAVATSTTPAEAHAELRARVAIGTLMTVTWIWSLSLVSGVRARGFIWPITGFLLFLFSVQSLVFPLNSDVLAVERTAMPWGEELSIPKFGPTGWWFWPIYLIAIAIEVFGLICGSRLWQRDGVAGVLVLSAVCGVLLVHAVEIMRGFGYLPVPFIGVVPMVPWVCVIAVLIARGRRQTRDQLAASEQRFRGIFDQTFQFIGLTRTDGILIEVNRTALEFARVRDADVIGKPLWETPGFADAPELQAHLQQAIRDAAAGSMVRFEVTYHQSNGSLSYIDFSIKPLRNEAGQVVLLIPEGRDITELKGAEMKKRALEAQLAQAQKMEAVGRLAGGMAHDFNNLLTVINGYSEILREMTPLDDSRAVMLEGINEAGERAAALTRQLLTFSRRQVVEPRVLELNAVVADTEKMLKRLIGEDITLVTVLHPSLARIKADPRQLGQVIVNLAVNARDAMPTGGTLTIATRNCDTPEDYPEILSTAGPGPFVLLAVSDTGAGMTPEVREQIFEPFFTTKGPGTGTGLGLATVRTIVEESGGMLSVDSTPGRGTTFRAFLPALEETTSSGATEPNATPMPRGNEIVLLVEDEEAVRVLTRRLLQQFGYTVLEATGGAEAIALVEQHTGTIDLLITDVVMPEIGGRKLVERLAIVRPGLKVLYLSGYTDDAVVRHGVQEADVAFLQKPYTIEALANKVRQTLDAGAVETERIQN